METKTDPIHLIDWWKSINYLPIGSKLISLIKSRGISEKDSKLLGVTDQDIYFAKKRVYMKEGDVTITRIEDSIKELELTWTDIKNYEYATVL
tara:strand:- start:96 stop:374 length:279 start_codon:yes stop_codon:yes gene_type:complete